MTVTTNEERELDDLRPVLADILDGLARPSTDYDTVKRLQRGAETLRWCAEREDANYLDQLLDQIDREQARVAELEDAIERLVRDVRG